MKEVDLNWLKKINEVDTWGGEDFLKERAKHTTPIELDLDFGQAHIRSPSCLGKRPSFITLSIKIKRTLKTFDGCFYSLELNIDSGLVRPQGWPALHRVRRGRGPGCTSPP